MANVLFMVCCGLHLEAALSDDQLAALPLHFCVLFLLQGGMCTLFVADKDKVISVASEHLEPVCPEKGDRVSDLCSMFCVSYSASVV